MRVEVDLAHLPHARLPQERMGRVEQRGVKQVEAEAEAEEVEAAAEAAAEAGGGG